MATFFQKNKWYFLGLIILAWVIYINLFPKGYIIIGGDTPQLIDAGNNFSRYFFEWQGRVSFYYFIFYLLSIMSISDTVQLSFYLAIFIFGSYISFDIFTRLIFNKASDFARMVMSLFYALNLYTLYVFTYAWGYSHYQIIYIFIPALTALYIKFLKTRKNIYAALFLLVLFFSSQGFANPAFALSLAIFFICLTILMVIVRYIKFDQILIKNILVLVLLSIMVNIYWILPLLPKMNSGIQEIYTSSALDFNWWLEKTANKIVDSIRLLQTEAMYFPNNYPYEAVPVFKKIFIALSFLPIFIVLLGASFFKKFSPRNRIFFGVFSILLVLFIMLVARVTPPFEKINFFVYHLWGVNMMRSYEKTAILTPFIFSTLLLIISLELEATKRFKKLLFALFFFIIIIPFPFYSGKLHQNMGALFVYDVKDYKQARNSFLVKIPDEYYNIRNIINNDKESISVATIPYNMTDTLGWSNFPKWKLIGLDITRLLYSKRFIDANGLYFDNWFFQKDFNESNSIDGNDGLIKLLGLMNAKYIIYHKDVETKLVENTIEKMNFFEKENLIVKIIDNDYFNLYQVKEDYVAPYISWQKEDINAKDVMKNFIDNPRENLIPADFEVINRQKIIVKSNQFNNDLILAEPYDSSWRAYRIAYDGKKTILPNHFKARGYANGWHIGNIPEKEILIEYYPLRLAYFGLGMSGVVIFVIILYLISYANKKNVIS